LFPVVLSISGKTNVKPLLQFGSALAIALLLTSSAPAEDGWKIPLWNPLSSSKSTGPGPVTQAAKAVASGTKKAWNTTVDVVTLKPVRQQFAPKQKSQFALGFKPDPRKKQASSSSWLGSLFQPKQPRNPQSMEEFFSLERPK
jgi:hypothetical protein